MNRSSWASGSGQGPSSAIGFWVAKTKNGGSSSEVRPCTVTRCSCIASSSAAWVLGGVRLISSASTTLAKIGPGMNTSLRWPLAGSSWMTSVPVTSDGMRSGVNWIREKRRSSARAREWISRVLARPGTPMSRQFPPASSATRVCSITASCPTMVLRSSATTRWRAAPRRSASAASSWWSSAGAEEAIVTRRPFESAGHGVDDVVHAQLVRLVGEVDREEPGVREFPVLAHVEAVVDDRHHPLLRIVVLEDAVELGLDPPIIGMLEVERRDPVEGVEDRVIGGERDEPGLRQHPAHLRLEVVPVRPDEVVHEEEAALLQVRAEPGHFLLVRRPVARLAEIGERELEQLRVVERQDGAAVGAHPHRGQLLEDLRKVGVRLRVVVAPLDVPVDPVLDAAALGEPDPRVGEAAVVARVRRRGERLAPVHEPLGGERPRHRASPEQAEQEPSGPHGDLPSGARPRSSSRSAWAFSYPGACPSTCRTSRRAAAGSPARARARASW